MKKYYLPLGVTAIGLGMILLNKDEAEPTEADILTHSDLNFKGIGQVVSVVGIVWLFARAISKQQQ